MDYEAEINGIRERVSYRDEDVRDIFLPMLKRWKRLKEEKGRRILVFLAAPPGAGKSTLLSFLKYLSERTEGCAPVTGIGMDGFHHYQDYLLSHTTVRGGQEIPMVKVKGAPETFDLELFRKKLQQVAKGELCGWPEYDRMHHNPREDALSITGDIVILEGNYLLLDIPGWRELREYADDTVKIEADERFLRERLVARRIKTGVSEEEAARFVDFSDMANVRLCLERSASAAVKLTVNERGYEIAADPIK